MYLAVSNVEVSNGGRALLLAGAALVLYLILRAPKSRKNPDRDSSRGGAKYWYSREPGRRPEAQEHTREDSRYGYSGKKHRKELQFETLKPTPRRPGPPGRGFGKQRGAVTGGRTLRRRSRSPKGTHRAPKPRYVSRKQTKKRKYYGKLYGAAKKAHNKRMRAVRRKRKP